MFIHQRILHHVHKHKEKVVAHVRKHQKKYILGASVLSGMAVYKIIGLIIMFIGMANMNGATTGADYYDVEFYGNADIQGKKDLLNTIDTGIVNQ